MSYSFDHPTPPPHRRFRLKGPWLIALIVVVVIMVLGIVLRLSEASSLKKNTHNAAVPDVVVTSAAHAPITEDVVLPGNVQAWHEAPIFARTSGYLKSWVTDIGTPVKEGGLIAEIETPEVDAQLRQAQADLNTAQANNKLAQRTVARWRELLKTNSVAKQEADEKIGAAEAAAATMASSQANVDRLQQLEGFKRIVAPFDGVITARNTDNGALINAGNSGVGPELFHIADISKLRVYVQVPQSYAPMVTPDLKAELHFAEHPGQNFQAVLVHSAQAIDPTSRTLLIELQADNSNGLLLAGGYTEVHLKLPTAADTVHLPVTTLLFRADGLKVATVDASSHVVLKPIEIGRDFGKEVEIKSGIGADEKVIENPPDSIADGQEVRIVEPKNKDAAAKGDAAKDGTSQDNKTDDKKGAPKEDKSKDDAKDVPKDSKTGTAPADNSISLPAVAPIPAPGAAPAETPSHTAPNTSPSP